jgi:hypothetical protein
VKGINPEKIPEFIRRDVELVKEGARFVLFILPDAKKVQIVENNDPRLDVFAIIGPSYGFGRHWDEVLLTEIGISRTRPYNEARGLARQLEQSNIHERRKWFSLSQQQYQLVAPIIFKMMDVRAERIISFWKTGSIENGFRIRTRSSWWSNHRKKLSFKSLYYAVPRGIRFNVSLKDEFFVRDVFWAEMNLNKRIKNQINGLAGFISKRLNWYNKKGNYYGKRDVVDLIGYQEVKECIQNCYLNRFSHLRVELAKKLKQDRRIISFFPRLADIFQWYGEETEESRLASSASQIPFLAERLGEIQILVTTDLSKKHDFITFEVQK